LVLLAGMIALYRDLGNTGGPNQSRSPFPLMSVSGRRVTNWILLQKFYLIKV